MKLKKMKRLKRALLRIAALALSTTLGFLSLAAAATAIELTPVPEQQAQAKTATLSGQNKKMLGGDNAIAATLANLIAKQQADEAARKAAEDAAAQQAAAQAAAQETGRSADSEYGAPAASNDEGEAWAILNGLISQYPILQGASVSFGDAQGYEAVCYYTVGCIVINPSHTYSLGELIYHEAMHLLNYRQSGQTTE